MKVLVLGAGVIGVTSAWYLNAAGHQVTVLERQPGVALETSFANGGQVSVSHAEPWANPHVFSQLLRWFGREDAPLLWRWRVDPAQLAWGLRFLRECTPGRTQANVAAIVALALYSRERLQTLRDELGLHYDQLARGILHVYTDPRAYALALEAARLMRQFGLDREPVDVDACLRIEPALTEARHLLVGGDYTPSDESGDAHLFTRQLAERAAAAGVVFRHGIQVDRMAAAGGRVAGVIASDGQSTDLYTADAYVVALGSHAPGLLRPLGVGLPIYPAKGYSATLTLADGAVAPSVSITDDERRLVFSRLGNRLRVAGTAEFNGFNLALNEVRCRALIERAQRLFPRLEVEGEPQFWCGLRPATPSNVPVIGRARRYANLWLNAGHGTLGWTMACGSGAALADLMSGRRARAAFPFLC
ncbi:D-amino acid dehydrogenase [Azonexus sp. R2A61]|uniref:D-amino acid dehydrogenase n=1 Tax=Azonexus sp. R2A61 TaxID=2744443 RepID=UPI001F36F56A|nr:D-amino acid dehydrogenase [Azonexus sp. R2A61]